MDVELLYNVWASHDIQYQSFHEKKTTSKMILPFLSQVFHIKICNSPKTSPSGKVTESPRSQRQRPGAGHLTEKTRLYDVQINSNQGLSMIEEKNMFVAEHITQLTHGLIKTDDKQITISTWEASCNGDTQLNIANREEVLHIRYIRPRGCWHQFLFIHSCTESSG